MGKLSIAVVNLEFKSSIAGVNDGLVKSKMVSSELVRDAQTFVIVGKDICNTKARVLKW